MVRNTHAGLAGIPPDIEESAEALDLARWACLVHVELPWASSAIMVGIKTAPIVMPL